MYLLDTNILSDANRVDYAPRLEEWLEGRDTEQMFVSVMSFGEIARGIERLPEARRRRELEAWMADLRIQFASRTLVVDTETAILWGRLRLRHEVGGEPPPLADLLIGATALRHGYSVVTRNVKDFIRFDVPVINPWDDENGA